MMLLIHIFMQEAAHLTSEQSEVDGISTTGVYVDNQFLLAFVRNERLA